MENTIKVLMIGTDRNLFQDGSAVMERIKEYGALVEELHIVVFALKELGFQTKQIAPNVWVYPTNSSSKRGYIGNAASLGNKIVFERQFIRGKSVITTQDPFECGWAGLKVKNKWRLPLEVQLHTDPFSPYFSGFLNWIRKIIAKKVLKKADHVRVVSGALQSAVASKTPARVSVLPIYVEREDIEQGKISFDIHNRYGWSFILLTVARLAPEKNLSLALEALALVRAKFPGVGLLVVGSGSEERKLRVLAKKLNLVGAVEFVGWQNDLASFYRTANVFIQTSHFEGYGLALVEAGLSGLPVVTTPVGIAQELEHGKDAYIFPEGRPDLFAEGIVDLIENNQKRENLRFNLKRTLEFKLITKENYLAQLKSNWQETALKIKK